MASIIKANKLTEAQQKEIVQRANEAYDAGGFAVLQIISETVSKIAQDTPEYAEHVAFTLYVVESIRQQLAEVVRSEVHDEMPDNKIIS